MSCTWKEHWDETKERYEAWWRGDGLVVSIWGNGIDVGRPLDPAIAAPDPSSTPIARNDDPALFVEHERRLLNRKRFPLDIIPFVYVDYGTVPLAELLGAAAEPHEETVWYRHCSLSPDNDRELRFDAAHPAWKRMRAIAQNSRTAAAGRYCVGAPALCPGLDVLSELCGAEELMVDLVMDRGWVHRKLDEIQRASYAAMDALAPALGREDDSSFHAFFMLWAPERAALAQCDAAALISPEMFAEFAVPYLRDFCRRIEHVLYHVDGPDALRTVDLVLSVGELEAVEFTPGPQVPGGGDPCWYDLYRKIKEAGKSVQAVWIKVDEVEALLDAVGPDGMYLEVEISNLDEAEEVERIVRRFR